MRSLIAFLLIPLLAIPSLPAQLAVTGPNQGMTLYCSGAGCGAYGTPVLDLANDTNWTLFTRLLFDPLIPDGNRFLFSQSTLVGGAFTCAGIYLNVPKSGATMPVDVNLTITGGISSFTIFSSSSNLGLGTWNSIALTHTSLHVWKLYINGVLDATFSGSEPTINTGCDTFIATVSGATDCGGGDHGCVFVDTALFPATLSAGDVNALARGTRPNQVSSRPAEWYPMDTGRPAPCGPVPGHATDIDASGNQHNLEGGLDPSYDYCASAASQSNSSVINPSGEATH